MNRVEQPGESDQFWLPHSELFRLLRGTGFDAVFGGLASWGWSTRVFGFARRRSARNSARLVVGPADRSGAFGLV
jgi:hypothetical protein